MATSLVSFLDVVFPGSSFALILISGWCFPLLFPRIASMVASCSLIYLSLSRCASRGYLQPVWAGERSLVPVYRSKPGEEPELIAQGDQQTVVLTSAVDGQPISW